MNKFDSIVLDLDGTLWNAAESSALGWTKGLASLGFNKVITANDIESVSGSPYPECIRKLCPEVSEEQLVNVMKVLSHFEKIVIEEKGGMLYEEVFLGLQLLKEKYRLFLVSNCQEWYLDSFFKHSKTKEFFEGWDCYGRTGNPKLENLKNLALKYELKNPAYVGDTESDYVASLGAHYEFLFVSYGFGKVNAPVEFSSFSKMVHALT